MTTKSEIFESLNAAGIPVTTTNFEALFYEIRHERIRQGGIFERIGAERVKEIDYPLSEVAFMFKYMIDYIGNRDESAKNFRQHGFNDDSLYEALETFMTRREYVDFIMGE